MINIAAILKSELPESSSRFPAMFLPDRKLQFHAVKTIKYSLFSEQNFFLYVKKGRDSEHFLKVLAKLT